MKNIIDIDPDIIYFTHSRVRPLFTGCNKRIEQTFEEIRNGETSIEDIPLITVIANDGHYFSLNNRRLYLWKWLKQDGGLEPHNTIRAYLKQPLEREKLRYIPSRCTLHAKLMKEHKNHTSHEVEEDRSAKSNDLEVEDEEMNLKSDKKEESADNIDTTTSVDCDSKVLGSDESVDVEQIVEKKGNIKSRQNHFALLDFDEDEDEED